MPTHQTARFRRLTGGLLAVPLLVLAACGSSSTKASTSAGSSGTSAPTTATPAASGPATAGTRMTSIGEVLTDPSGLTLYFNDNEKGGRIACTGSCATAWPPVTVTGQPVAPAGVSGLGTISRPDGTTQLTYQSRPMYRFAADSAPGDTKGDGIAGIWHAAKVSAAGTGGGATATTASGGGGYNY